MHENSHSSKSKTDFWTGPAWNILSWGQRQKAPHFLQDLAKIKCHHDLDNRSWSYPKMYMSLISPFLIWKCYRIIFDWQKDLRVLFETSRRVSVGGCCAGIGFRISTDGTGDSFRAPAPIPANLAIDGALSCSKYLKVCYMCLYPPNWKMHFVLVWMVCNAIHNADSN